VNRQPRQLYTCPYCGETLSSPPRFYTCPRREQAHVGGDADTTPEEGNTDEPLHS
jgi:hypothetical protein